MSKATAGPWRVEFVQEWPFGVRVMAGENTSILQQSACAHSTVQKSRGDCVTGLGFSLGKQRDEVVAAIAEQDANAKLIASAPHLLELLKESQSSIGGDWRNRRDALLLEIGQVDDLYSTDNPPFGTLEPTPAWPAELMLIGAAIRKRHPAHCRCSGKVVTGKLTTIMRDTADGERSLLLRYIDAQHAKWCASEAWTKEGGKFAKSLEAWLNPARRLWENEPLAVESKPEYVDRYVNSGGVR